MIKNLFKNNSSNVLINSKKVQAKMEVNRSDPKWLDIYKTNKDNEPEVMKLKVSDSIWRSYQTMEKVRAAKKKRSIKVIDFIPDKPVIRQPVSRASSSSKKCQSSTMSGKPCQYKAVSECGRFCKKHIL